LIEDLESDPHYKKAEEIFEYLSDYDESPAVSTVIGKTNVVSIGKGKMTEEAFLRLMGKKDNRIDAVLGDITIIGNEYEAKIRFAGQDNESLEMGRFLIIKRTKVNEEFTLRIISSDKSPISMRSNGPADNNISRSPVYIMKVEKSMFVLTEKKEKGYLSINGVSVEGDMRINTLDFNSKLTIGGVLDITISKKCGVSD